MAGSWWKDYGELVEEQLDVLNVPLDRNLLIKGPPGSGKTNLLLLRANHLYLADEANINIVVFGSVLRNFIQLGGGQYAFPAAKVVTHARLFSEVLADHARPVDTRGLDLTTARARKLQELDSLLAAGHLGRTIRTVLLDEAQDYSPGEVRVFRELSHYLTAAGDAKQKIFNSDDCMGDLEGLVDEVRVLKFHFRNGRKICKLADEIMAGKRDYFPMEPNCQYDESEYPSSVQFHSGLDISSQAGAIELQLLAQRDAYPEDILGVLCPKVDDLNKIAEVLSQGALGSEFTACHDSDFDPSKRVWLCTTSSAKGLEFRAVHLAGLDQLSNVGRDAQRRLAFTAVTRAKTALTLYWNEKVPAYLDGAVRKVVPSTRKISMAMLFGKGDK